MSVTAKQLSKTAARGKDIDSIIREHLLIIDDTLLKADRTWGRNVVPYDLPTSFAIPGLKKKDAQRIIYSAIIRSLEKRGFETRLLLEGDISRVYVAWMTDLDIAEVQAMNALIIQKRITSQDLRKFIEQGAIVAPRAAIGARWEGAATEPPLNVTESNLVMQPRNGLGVVVSTEMPATPAGLSAAESELLKN